MMRTRSLLPDSVPRVGWASTVMGCAFTLAGCNWISDADLAARAGQVDDDGDGVPFSRDCNEADPNISPASAEIWYDGIDQDCLGGDDYDQDGDGYVPNDYIGLTTKDLKQSGALPGNDCDDQNASVSPQAVDVAYDGEDTSCDGGDDYDQDGDGYVLDEYVGLATLYVDTSGGGAGGECDDENAGVNPGIQDVEYDGVDADCAGNDDYDLDADGYVLDEYHLLPTTYVSGSGSLPKGDCDDADASFSPGVTETWYSGADEACDGFDDYDQDNDGYVPNVHVGKTTAGLDGTGALEGGDCVDTDDTIRPRAAEVPGDVIDQDCDGGESSVAAASILGFTWETPLAPILVYAEDRLYLSVATAKVDTALGDTWHDAGFALYWDEGVILNDSAVIGELAWSGTSTNPTYTVGSAHDFVLHGTTLYGALGLTSSTSRSLRLVSYPLGAGSAGSSQAQSAVATDGFEDVSVAIGDDDVVYAVGCDGGSNGVLTYVRVDELVGTSASWSVLSNVTDGSGATSSCAMDLDGGPQVLLAYDGEIYGMTFDPTSNSPTFTSSEISDIADPDDIDVHPSASVPVVLADSDAHIVVVTDLDGFNFSVGQPADSPVSASAVETLFGDWFVGWVNSTGTVRVAWGNAADGFTYQTVAVTGTATGVAVWSNGTEGMVAVTTATDLGIGIYEW